jgi:carbamoyl-phosphate synthase large subunit
MHNILITGIGGNVGQGILRIIKTSFPELNLIGTDVNEYSAGHFYVDDFVLVPYASDTSYQKTIRDVCVDKNINLIIPGTDLEAYFLQSFALSTKVLASAADSQKIFLDKYLTYINFEKYKIPFAKSFKCSEYNFEFDSVIVKPAEGRGSRGLHVNPVNPKGFTDEYIVQEYITGQEITSAFYITKDQRLLGPISFERKLTNGMTSECQTITNYDDQLKAIAEQIKSSFEMLGPFNIQARINSKGEVIPFEINCRYSGTNSIRHQLGFTDVMYGIKEHIYDEEVKDFDVKSGCATRIYLDIVYENIQLNQIKAGKDGAKLF